MWTQEEIPHLTVTEASGLEARTNCGIEFVVAEVGEVSRFALLAALDEDPDDLAEEFRRADCRPHLSPFPSELSIGQEHANDFRLTERRCGNRLFDCLRLY
jgi:hypothetical protein